MLKTMARLSKDDVWHKRIETTSNHWRKKQGVEVADNMHQLAVKQWEKSTPIPAIVLN